MPAGYGQRNGRSVAEAPHMAKVLARLLQEADLMSSMDPPLLAVPGGIEVRCRSSTVSSSSSPRATVRRCVKLRLADHAGQGATHRLRLRSVTTIEPSVDGGYAERQAKKPGPSPPDIMRVLQLHTRYRQAGGEDRVVVAEAELLRSAGHEWSSSLRTTRCQPRQRPRRCSSHPGTRPGPKPSSVPLPFGPTWPTCTTPGTPCRRPSWRGSPGVGCPQ